MFKLVTHVAVLRRCSSIIWDKPEQAADCASYCHGTQNVGSNRVHDCPLSVRAATMATRAWTKQIVSWISGLSVVKTWSNLSHRVYHPSVSSLRWSLPVIVHSWDGLLTHTQKKHTQAACCASTSSQGCRRCCTLTVALHWPSHACYMQYRSL